MSAGGASGTVADLAHPGRVPVLGPVQSRVVMSAMTRDQAGDGHCATPAMAEYYARRAAGGVGLILTEGTIVDPAGDGYRQVPRLCTQAQADSWRPVTARVHEEGGLIFCQLWHCGRISHPDFLDGAAPVSSTDRAAEGINRQNGKPYGVPRRLEAVELPGIYRTFVTAAGYAMSAGFDGVELHMAHGYLPDQFLDGHVNDRQDDYGGSVERRCRFGLELVQAVLAACGPTRVMVRLSPSRIMQGRPYDWPDQEAMLTFLIPELDRLGLRMLDISCASANYAQASGRVIRAIRPFWPHLLIGGASLTRAEAQGELDAGVLDMVTYGRTLVANPDFVHRLRSGATLRPYDRSMLDTLE
jgi:2,4-dienoyl-CoA reductase-like NADH-dependent reductase (Old Yellow Enzyme family)